MGDPVWNKQSEDNRDHGETWEEQVEANYTFLVLS